MIPFLLPPTPFFTIQVHSPHPSPTSRTTQLSVPLNRCSTTPNNPLALPAPVTMHSQLHAPPQMATALQFQMLQLRRFISWEVDNPCLFIGCEVVTQQPIRDLTTRSGNAALLVVWFGYGPLGESCAHGKRSTHNVYWIRWCDDYCGATTMSGYEKWTMAPLCTGVFGREAGNRILAGTRKKPTRVQAADQAKVCAEAKLDTWNSRSPWHRDDTVWRTELKERKERKRKVCLHVPIYRLKDGRCRCRWHSVQRRTALGWTRNWTCTALCLSFVGRALGGHVPALYCVRSALCQVFGENGTTSLRSVLRYNKRVTISFQFFQTSTLLQYFSQTHFLYHFFVLPTSSSASVEKFSLFQ